MEPKEKKESARKAGQAVEKLLLQGEPDEKKNPSPEGVYASETSPSDTDSREAVPICVREDASAYDAKPQKRQGEYTVEDYYAWPDEQRIELIDGVIYVMEAPTFVHQRIASKVLFAIQSFFEKKGGDCIPLLSPLNVRLDCDDRTMVQPDLVILCDRDKIKRWGIMGAPDFILEILSPSTRRKDCIKKLQKYSDAGVREYWIIDPRKRVLLTYDFTQDDMPCLYPLTGTAGIALYNGELQIDLDEISGLIQDWPD